MAKKKKALGKIAGKQIRKQVRSLKGDVKDVGKGVAKQVTKATKRMTKQNTAIRSELSKLSEDLKTLKGTKQTPKRELSMYNLFVRKQIQQGKSFEEAVKSWKSSRKMIENPELAKARPKTKTRTITKTKVVVRKVPVYPKRITASPSPQTKESLDKIMRELHALKTEVSSLEKEAKPMPKIMKSAMHSNSSSDLPMEEVAVRLTRLYFEEIARLGFKRRLDFDAIINAYYYCMQRLQNKDKELEVMRKIVEREENKLTTETKAQMFPTMNEG